MHRGRRGLGGTGERHGRVPGEPVCSLGDSAPPAQRPAQPRSSPQNQGPAATGGPEAEGAAVPAREHPRGQVGPRLPSGTRGWVVGSLCHPASRQGSEGGWWGHCSTCLPLRVRGWVVGSRCRALLGRPLLSLHPAGPLGGWTWYPVQFRSVLCALALCQVSGVCRNTVQGHYCVSSSVIPNSLPSHGLSPVRLLCPWDFPGKNTGAGCHFLLQGIFPTQDSNADLHCRQILFRPSHQGSPK